MIFDFLLDLSLNTFDFLSDCVSIGVFLFLILFPILFFCSLFKFLYKHGYDIDDDKD